MNSWRSTVHNSTMIRYNLFLFVVLIVGIFIQDLVIGQTNKEKKGNKNPPTGPKGPKGDSPKNISSMSSTVNPQRYENNLIILKDIMPSIRNVIAMRLKLLAEQVRIRDVFWDRILRLNVTSRIGA